MKPIKNFSNKLFYKILMIKAIRKDNSGHYVWLCKCFCGTFFESRGSSIKSGGARSCGCLVGKSRLGKKFPNTTTHGLTGTQFYNIFQGIKQRCNNKNSSGFINYGGRGIKCHWEKIEDFKKDMFKSYLEHYAQFGKQQTTIERKNNNGDYCKNNCKWATRSEQQHNKRGYKVN